MNKIIIKTGKYIFLLLLILILSGSLIVIFSNIYKEELKNFVFEELNKEINVKIEVKSVNISAFCKFPFISVVLNDVNAWSSPGFQKELFTEIDTDTLFSASKVYLQFNILDIIKKNYQLKRAHILNGKANLLTDAAGQVNYRLFKEQKKSTQDTVSFKFDGVKISGIKWNYVNLSKNIFAEGDLKDIILKGNFSHSDYILNIEGSCLIDSAFKDDIQYALQLNIGLNVNLAVSNSLFIINKGELNLNNMNFNLAGSFILEDQTNLDLQVMGNNLDIKSFFTSLPFKIKLIEKFNPKGTFDFLTSISGIMSHTAAPDLRAAFRFINVKAYLPEKKIWIEELNVKGTYSNGNMHNARTGSIKISEYSFINGKTWLHGNFSIDNFIHPLIIADISGSIDAKHLSELLSIRGLNIQKGVINPEISLTTSLKDLKHFKKDKINTLNISGKFILDSISGNFPGINEHFDYLDGVIKVDGDRWFPELIARSKESDIRIKVEADHILGRFIFNKTSLCLRGDLYSHYLDLKRFLVNESKLDTSKYFLPERLNIIFNYSTDSLIFGKFRAENISADFNYKEGIMSISSLALKTLKGRIIANGMLIQKPNGDMIIKSQSNLNNIDINDMFYTFNNFAQKFIISENLRGLVSGNVEMSMTTDNNFKPFFNTLIADSDITVLNGELIGFEPIMSLSKYISLSELEHIKFSSLHNGILIQDSKVYIPKMDINSSAFNITASGTHSFENYFEYKVKVNLSEILARKASKAKKENEEFGIIEKDDSGSTSIYLAISGTPDDYKVRYDKKEALTNIRNDLQKEKKTLKSILQEEFNFSKKDTIVSKESSRKASDQFIIEWDEDENDTSGKNKKKDPDNAKKPEFEIEW